MSDANVGDRANLMDIGKPQSGCGCGSNCGCGGHDGESSHEHGHGHHTHEQLQAKFNRVPLDKNEDTE